MKRPTRLQLVTFSTRSMQMHLLVGSNLLVPAEIRYVLLNESRRIRDLLDDPPETPQSLDLALPDEE